MKYSFCILFLFSSLIVSAQQTYTISFTHVDKTVHGTFLTPDGSGPFPTILIVPGSGANDRDGTLQLVGTNAECLYPGLNGQTIKPYKELAEALVDSGYAVLRYDKLEYTYPSNLGTITFEKLWLPAESAIDYLKTRQDVDTTNIILLGHSEGSALIPYIAKNRSDIKALISLAGARTPFDSLLAHQLVHFERLCDGDTILAKAQADQILTYFAAVRTSNCLLLPPVFGVSACVWKDYYEATDAVSENYNQLDLPLLFLGLGLDINVPLTELERLKGEVTSTDDFWAIPDLIHYMVPNNDTHVSQVLTDTIVYWLRENNLNTGILDKPLKNDHLVRIYPNPIQHDLNVQFDEASGKNAIFSVIDLNGKIVMVAKQNSDIVSEAKLNLKTISPGTYYLKIESDKINTIRKIVKL